MMNNEEDNDAGDSKETEQVDDIQGEWKAEQWTQVSYRINGSSFAGVQLILEYFLRFCKGNFLTYSSG